MKSYSDNKQQVIEIVPNGANFYRYNFKEILNPATDFQEERKQWECEEVIIWSPLTKDKITAAVINEKWVLNYENKLLNDYYAAIEGILPIEKKQGYLDFLVERKLLKEQIEKDCEEFGIF